MLINFSRPRAGSRNIIFRRVWQSFLNSGASALESKRKFEMEAVILAGGLGTRLRSAVANIPKPMAEIQGRPFLEYLVNFWADQGVRHFVLSVGYRHELIQGHFGTSFRGFK